MGYSISQLVSELKLNPPTTIERIRRVESALGVSFPREYVEFMLTSNGGEGTIGTTSYLALWPIQDIIPRNEGCGVEEFIPKLLLFGSDGAEMAYAFDKREQPMPIVEHPFDSIHIEESKRCADTFVEFLRYLYEQE